MEAEYYTFKNTNFSQMKIQFLLLSLTMCHLGDGA